MGEGQVCRLYRLAPTPGGLIWLDNRQTHTQTDNGGREGQKKRAIFSYKSEFVWLTVGNRLLQCRYWVIEMLVFFQSVVPNEKYFYNWPRRLCKVKPAPAIEMFYNVNSVIRRLSKPGFHLPEGWLYTTLGSFSILARRLKLYNRKYIFTLSLSSLCLTGLSCLSYGHVNSPTPTPRPTTTPTAYTLFTWNTF